jgi:SNF2 family DNA or RNA helicase
MTFELLPHQIEDAVFLSSRIVAGCFNGMGTGKTRTALQALIEADAGRALIVAPPIALRMWANEAHAHLGNVTAQILSKGSMKIIPQANILICSYEIATKRQADLMEWATQGSVYTALICDESHALKSVTAKRTKAILGEGGMVEAFDYSWFLTGTPVTRWSDDLWPFLRRAAPELLERRIGRLTLDRFNLRYCITQQRLYPGARRPKAVVVGSRNNEELGQILATCATRRTLDDVWRDMPPITYTRLPVEVSGEWDKIIKDMTFAQIEAALVDPEQPLATARREMGLSLIEEAGEFITDRVDAGSGAILVGAWHREVIDGLVDRLTTKGLRAAKLDGRTPQDQKVELQRRFNDGDLHVLVGQIGAMGVSLNLQQGGNSIVVVEEDWSPSVMDQFYARLHRMGQGRPVHVDTIYVDNKLAQAIYRISQSKKHAAAEIASAHQEARH